MMLWESGYPPALGKSSTEKKSNEKSGKTGFNEKPWGESHGELSYNDQDDL